MSGCGGQPISGAQYFLFSPEEIEKLELKVEDGSAEAAFKLYEHYAFGEDDHTEAVKWLVIADKKGHPKTKSHLTAYEENGLLIKNKKTQPKK